jgi:hypothetical protein
MSFTLVSYNVNAVVQMVKLENEIKKIKTGVYKTKITIRVYDELIDPDDIFILSWTDVRVHLLIDVIENMISKDYIKYNSDNKLEKIYW